MAALNLGTALMQLLSGSSSRDAVLASADPKNRYNARVRGPEIPEVLVDPEVPALPIPPNAAVPVADTPATPVVDASTPSEADTPVVPEEPPAPEAISAPLPEAYKSPPDLVEMYTKLMQKSTNAARMDRGLTLIAAGLAQDQNKQALINAAFSGGGGAGSGAPSMTDIINLQKMQTEAEGAARQRAQLPALMEQYNLDPATVQYLDATGQLDETIKELATPETEVVEAADGSKKLINSKDGTTIRELSARTPRATEYVDKGGPGGKVLVYTDDKTPVAGGPPVTDIPPAEKDITTVELADGREQAVQNGKPVGEPFGPMTKSPITVTELANGQQQAVQDGKPISEPWGPETKITTPDITEWQQINAGRKSAGLPEIRLDDWIVTKGHAQTEAGAQADLDKTRFGNPPPGKFFLRDATGAVLTNPDGTPQTKWDTESKEYADFVKTKQTTEQEAIDAARKAGKVAGTETAAEVEEVIVDQTIKDAIDMVEKGETEQLIPNVGLGGLLSFWPGSPQRTLSNYLEDVKSHVSIDALQAIRDAAATGGGLGNITDKDVDLLKRNMGSLDIRGDPAVLVRNLKRMNVGMKLIANGVEDPPGSNKFRKATDADVKAALDVIQMEPIKPRNRGNFKVKRVD